MFKRNLSIFVAAGLALAMMAVAALAQGGDSSPADGISPIEAVQPQAEQAMTDSLGDNRQTHDALPSDVANAVSEHPKFGMNPDLSRQLIANTTNSVYAVPADGHVCVALTVGEGATFGCPTTDSIAQGEVGAGTVTLDGGAIGIYGLVPDGVDSITLNTGTTDTATVPVTENAYYTAVEQGTPLRSIAYTGPSGPVEYAIYDPATAFSD